MSEFEMMDQNVTPNNEVPEVPANDIEAPKKGLTNLEKSLIGAIGIAAGIKLGSAMNKEEASRHNGDGEKKEEKRMLFFKKKTTPETTETKGEDAIDKFLDSLTNEQLDALKARIDTQKEINKKAAELEALRAKR